MAVGTAYEDVTVSTTAKALTAATYGDSTGALISVESQAVRFTFDGTTPTSTKGHALEAGDVLKLTTRDELQNIRFIRRDGSDATLRVTYLVG